jgi:hypothetical protein
MSNLLAKYLDQKFSGNTPMVFVGKALLEAVPWVNVTTDIFGANFDTYSHEDFVDITVRPAVLKIDQAISVVFAADKTKGLIRVRLPEKVSDLMFNPFNPVDVVGAVSWAIQEIIRSPEASSPSFKAFYKEYGTVTGSGIGMLSPLGTSWSPNPVSGSWTTLQEHARLGSETTIKSWPNTVAGHLELALKLPSPETWAGL